jgi:hypothetical protein
VGRRVMGDEPRGGPSEIRQSGGGACGRMYAACDSKRRLYETLYVEHGVKWTPSCSW